MYHFSARVGTSARGSLPSLFALGAYLGDRAIPDKAWADPSYITAREEFGESLSRTGDATKALPGALIRGVPASLRDMAPGMQGGDLARSGEDAEAQKALQEMQRRRQAAQGDQEYAQRRANIQGRRLPVPANLRSRSIGISASKTAPALSPVFPGPFIVFILPPWGRRLRS